MNREVSLAALTQVLCDTEVIMSLVLEPYGMLLCCHRHLLDGAVELYGSGS